MNFLRNLFSRLRVRGCGVCPEGCTYCSKTGQCNCNEHVPQGPCSAWPRRTSMSPTEQFAIHCELNPGAPECRIYED